METLTSGSSGVFVLDEEKSSFHTLWQISNIYYQLATFESCKTCDGAISDDFILLTFDHSNYEFKEILNE